MNAVSLTCPKCTKAVKLNYVGIDKNFNVYQCPNCALPIRFKKKD